MKYCANVNGASNIDVTCNDALENKLIILVIIIIIVIITLATNIGKVNTLYKILLQKVCCSEKSRINA